MDGLLAYLRELNIFSMMLRLTLSIIMGGFIGMERETRGRAAGFRTYMLVALGATVTILLGQYLDIMLTTAWADRAGDVLRSDVARMGAQVINGVGFLGAGTIIVTSRQEIKGVTTAAGLWASACMGLAIGAGFYECMLFAVVLMLLCMRAFSAMERSIVSGARNMNIYVELDGVEKIGAIMTAVKNSGIKMYDVEIDKRPEGGYSRVSAVFSVGLPKGAAHMDVLAGLSTAPGLLAIKEV